MSTRVPPTATTLFPREQLSRSLLTGGEIAAADARSALRLEHLMNAAQTLAGAVEPSDVFAAVCAGIRTEIDGIDRIAMVIRPDPGIDAELAISTDSAVMGSNPPAWVSSTVCRLVYERGDAVKTIDALMDSRLQDAASINLSGARTVAAVPIGVGMAVFGVLYADAPTRIRAVDVLSAKDFAFLAALAGIAAQAIRRTFLQGQLQQEELRRGRLARYHNASVVRELLSEQSIAGGRVPPASREVAVMFADIAGFTAMSQRSEPAEVAAVLDRIFAVLVEELFEAGGTLDKYIGDCIMAFFGAPEQQTDFADRAVRAARGMMRRFQALHKANAIPPEIGLRVAIASGPAVVGDIGSPNRVEYTVLGTTVNRASRIEGAIEAGSIGFDRETFERLTQRSGLFELGEFNLKGLGAPTVLYGSIW